MGGGVGELVGGCVGVCERVCVSVCGCVCARLQAISIVLIDGRLSAVNGVASFPLVGMT
jgi:hypothetical protein